MNTTDRDMIATAAAFANRAHFACKQTRKGSGLPYIVHPIRVASLVEQYGGTPEQIAAAWCHDVLEDCADYREEAAAILTPPVLALVSELTKAEIAPGKRVKGEAFMAELRAMSPAAKLIKLSDRLDNLRDAISVNDPSWARKYADESVEVLAALKTNPPVGHGAKRLAALIRTQIKALHVWADQTDGGQVAVPVVPLPQMAEEPEYEQASRYEEMISEAWGESIVGHRQDDASSQRGR